jgi:hypothetical protein
LSKWEKSGFERANLWEHGLKFCLIYLLTAVGLSSGGSKHLHKNNTYNNTNNNRTTQITTNVEECGPCPVFASFTLAFALQLRKKHGKPSARVRKTSEYSIHITKTPTHYKTLINTHINIVTYYSIAYSSMVLRIAQSA